MHGPVNPRSRGYQGNPSWTSFVTGQVFQYRPEDRSSLFGIANSGYPGDGKIFVADVESAYTIRTGKAEL